MNQIALKNTTIKNEQNVYVSCCDNQFASQRGREIVFTHFCVTIKHLGPFLCEIETQNIFSTDPPKNESFPFRPPETYYFFFFFPRPIGKLKYLEKNRSPQRRSSCVRFGSGFLNSTQVALTLNILASAFLFACCKSRFSCAFEIGGGAQDVLLWGH